MIKNKRGQKSCPQCKIINGARSFQCKSCGHMFAMKKKRRGKKRTRILDYTTLKKGDIIKVIGGTGPYYEDDAGVRHYLTERGKYTVDGTDDSGIKCWGPSGYDYLYMGESCRSKLLHNIMKEPHKILMIQSLSQPNHGIS